MRARLSITLALGGLIALVPVARAQDQCGLPTGFERRDLYPPEGAVGVPLNAVMVVRYLPRFDQTPGFGPEVVLRPRQGEPVQVVRELLPTHGAGTIVGVRLKPSQPLLPATTYELLDQVRVPCQLDPGLLHSPDLCRLPAPAVFATFTTGSAMDTTPPTFAGATALNARPFFVCPPRVHRPFTVRWGQASDDVAGEALAFNLYALGEPAIATYVRGDSAELAISCHGNGVSPWFIEARYQRNYTGRNESGSYYVRAVDWAGNEDPNRVAVTITDPCVGAPLPDAGASGPVDVADAAAQPDTATNLPDAAPAADAAALDAASEAGAPTGPPDASVGKPATGGGCSVATDGARPGPALSCALLAAVMWRLRRRSSERQTIDRNRRPL